MWYCYYLSPYVLWKSLMHSIDPDLGVDSEVSFELWGVPIIVVARYVFGVLTVLQLAAGIVIAKTGGMPLWSYRRSGDSGVPRGSA